MDLPITPNSALSYIPNDLPDVPNPVGNLGITDLLTSVGGPSESTQPVDLIKSGMGRINNMKADFEQSAQPTYFNYDRSQAERYISSDYFQVNNFDPDAGQANEYKYGRMQTTGNMFGNALAGAYRLGAQTFVDGWKGWGRMTDALTSFDASKLVGDPEDLRKLSEEQEKIMNKYAIYATPESEETVFNKQLLGNMIQQSGFALGATAQFLSEELLTMGLSSTLSFAKLGLSSASKIGKGVYKTGELIADQVKLGAVYKQENLVKQLFKNATKGSAVGEMIATQKAGGSVAQIAAIGLGGFRRTLAESNMAFTEARMEAAGTYSDLYDKMYYDYTDKNGRVPDTAEQERMKGLALDAAQDNFKVNAGVLAVMNRIQFDNLFTKFGSERKLLKAVGTFKDDVISVSGKMAVEGAEDIAKEGTRVYAKGIAGTVGALGDIAKDFGAKRAAWEGTKALGKNLSKWEASEGIQELIQEGSNVAMQDYYYDLYDGKSASWDKSIDKATESQYSQEGFKTFLMGALTGRLISPITGTIGKVSEIARISSKDRKEREEELTNSVALINEFYQNPSKALNEAIANFKVQNKAAETMEEALANRDEYTYNNSKDSALAKLVSAAKKTDMLESVIDTIHSYGDVMDQEQMKEAFPTIDPTENNIQSAKEYFNKIANEIKGFSKNWEELKDRYSDLVMPELFEEGSEQRKEAMIAKRALDDAIEMLATNRFKATRATERAGKLYTEVAKNIAVGNSSAAAFRIMGSDNLLKDEVKTLSAELALLSQSTVKDDAVREQIRLKTAELAALNKWTESWEPTGEKTAMLNSPALRKAYAEYISAKNASSKLDTTVSYTDMETSWAAFMDYISLNKDNQDYIDAYNTLANPMRFTQMIEQSKEGIRSAMERYKQEAIEEARKKADVEEKKDDENPPADNKKKTLAAKHTVAQEEDGTWSILNPKGVKVDGGHPTEEMATEIAGMLDMTLRPEDLVPDDTDDDSTEDTTDDQQDAEEPTDGEPLILALYTAPVVLTKPKLDAGESIVDSNNGVFVVKSPAGFVVINSEGKGFNEEKPDAVLIYGSQADAVKAMNDVLAKREAKEAARRAPFNFGGKTVQAGQVLSDPETGKKYKVKDLPDTQNKTVTLALLNDELKETKTKVYPTSLEKYAFVYKDQAVKKPGQKKFKWQRVNELARIYPVTRKEDGDQKEAMAQARLDELLINTPQAVLLAGLSIKAKVTGAAANERLAGDKSNANLKQSSEKLTMEVQFNGETIGFISNYNSFNFYDNKGRKVAMDKLDDAQFQTIFDVQGRDVKKTKEAFIAAYLNSRAVYNNVLKALNDAGQNSVTLIGEQLTEVMSPLVTTGEFDFVQTPVALSDLSSNTIDGHVFVLDRQRVYDGKSNKYTIPEDVFITSAPKEIRKKIAAEVKALLKSERDVTELLGRYVAVVRLPNGKVRFLELTTPVMEDAQLEGLIKKIGIQSKLAADTNTRDDVNDKGKQIKKAVNVAFNDEVNKELADNIFIALPDNKGTYFNISVSPTGAVRMEVSFRPAGSKEIENRSIPVGNPKFDTIEDFVISLNTAIEAHDKKALKKDKLGITLKRENFKVSQPEGSMNAKTVMSLVTKVSPKIVKNVQFLAAKGTAVAAPPVEPPVIAQKGNKLTTPAPKTDTVTSTDGQAASDIERLKQTPAGKKIEEERQKDLQQNINIPEGNYVSPQKSAKETLTKFREYLTDVLGWDRMVISYNSGALVLDYLGQELRIPAKVVQLGGGVSEIGLNNVSGVAPTFIEIDVKDVINAKYDAELAALKTSQPVDERTTLLEKHKAVSAEIRSVMDQKDKFQTERAAELIAGGMGRIAAKKQAIAEAKKFDEQINQLGDQVDDINSQITALKVINKDSFDEKSVENLDRFRAWVTANLPESISVEEMDMVINRLKANQVTVGMFTTYLKVLQDGNTTLAGMIQVGANTPFKYHEAFHAVFRMLLNNKRIDQLLAVAKIEALVKLKKEGKTLSAALNELRESHAIYKSMSEQELEKRFYEEYMADEFDTFMKNPSKSAAAPGIKNFFQRILEWITGLFGKSSKLSVSELEGLFQEINEGKYKNTKVQENQFTTKQDAFSVTEPAMKVIKLGERQVLDENGNVIVIDNNMSQQESDQLASTIASLFHTRVLETAKYNKDAILEDILDMYQMQYDTSDPQTEAYYEALMDEVFDKNDPLYDEKIDQYTTKLEDYQQLFKNPINRRTIKESVDLHLQIMGYQQELEDDEMVANEDEYGNRVTTDNWKDSHSIGGFGSLSKFLRQYMAATTYVATDDFGNKEFFDGTPIVKAVEAGKVYNGLLKAVANIADQNKLVARLAQLRNEDSQTGKFLTKFFEDTGLVYDTEEKTFTVTNQKQATLFQMVVKGLQQYSVDYVFINKDLKKRVARLSLANWNGAAKEQFSRWTNAYIDLYLNQSLALPQDERIAFANERTSALVDLQVELDPTIPITDEALDKTAQEISNELKSSIGMALSPMFIKFSIAAAKEEKTEAQQELFDAYSEVKPIKLETVKQIILTMKTLKDPFFKNIDSLKAQQEEEENEVNEIITVGANGEVSAEGTPDEDTLGEGGNITRINELAKSNAIFDETVSTSSFKNADGELVYTYQLPTFHLVGITGLNETATLDKLSQDEFLKNNDLLNSPEFRSLQGDLKIIRIDGMKKSILVETDEGDLIEDRTIQANQNTGITYGSFGDREFLISLFDLYKFGSERKTEDGKTFHTSLQLIRVLEASNTGDTVALPVINGVETKGDNLTISNSVLETLLNQVKTEFARIKQVEQEIRTGEYIDGILEGYHTGEKPRGLDFYNMKNPLGALAQTLLDNFKADRTYEIDSKMEQSIIKQLNGYFTQEIDNLVADAESLGLLSKNKEGKLENDLIDGFIEDGFTKRQGGKDIVDERRNGLMNMIPGNLRHNMGQIFMNNYVNTLQLNQLLLGDEAKGIKDSIDAVKRAKGANGSGQSLYSEVLSDDLGINHAFDRVSFLTFKDPGYKKKYAKGSKNGDKADAQMYITPKGMRYTLFGLGKLKKASADILTKIENGEKLTKDEIFGEGGLKAMETMFNSLKLVYYDGNQYIKTSAVMLTKELTSVKVNGQWVAKVNRPELHDLRERLEKQEADENTVSFSGPTSLSKMVKKNVFDQAAGFANAQSDNFIDQDTNFWRLQLENPSNKIQITDPTQAKMLIMAEQDDNLDVDFMGTMVKMKDLKEMYLKDTDQRIKNNFFKAANQIFDIEGAFEELSKAIAMDKLTPKLAKFQERAIDTLRSSGADAQTIGFFELDKSGKPKYNLNNPVTLEKYTQLFLAYFSKGVMSEKIPGHSVALMSNYGMKMVKQVIALDENGQPSQWKVIPQAQVDADHGTYAGATQWNNDIDREFSGLKVGDYYVDDLRHNVPEYNEKGEIIGRYSEFVMPPHFKELMDAMGETDFNEFMFKAFGVRIPSQDKHSFISLKMVDFMPAYYGSTAVFPHELIEISGADFDIDKLYMHIAHTYLKDGKRVVFGTAVTAEEKFEEYQAYLLQDDKDFKTELNRVLSELRDINDVENELNDTSYTLGQISPDVIASVMVSLNLPHTVAAFAKASEKGELNNGVLNNRILHQKLAMINNAAVTTAPEGETPIAFEVASIDPLKDVIDELKTMFGGVAEVMELLDEKNTDVNSMRGQLAAFKNNKEGARNIGPAVNSMLVYSLLNSYNVQFRDTFLDARGEEQKFFKMNFNGETLEGYNQQRAAKFVDGKFVGYTGDRIFNTISTLVSAMTDNAKERLAARLGLNIEAIGYVANMVAQGMPLKSAAMFMIQPCIREYFAIVKEDRYSLKVSDSFTGKQAAVKELLAKYSAEMAGSPEFVDVTDQILEDNIRNNGANPSVQISILSDFANMMNQSEYFAKVAKLIKTTKGTGTTFAEVAAIKTAADELGLGMNATEFSKSDIPFDIRKVIGKDQKFLSTLVNIATVQIPNLSKPLFIQQTEVFQQIENLIRSNLRVRSSLKEGFDKNLTLDLISYLSIKAYKKTLLDKNRMGTLASMTNGLIYDGTAIKKKEEGEFDDIVDVIAKIRKAVPNNYLVNNFLNVIATSRTDAEGNTAVNENNKDGFNKLEANTWAKMSDQMIDKLSNSFMDLYQYNGADMNGREMATTLFNYLLVKDGGQFRSNSFIRFMPNFIFADLLQATGVVNDVMKLDVTASEEQYKKTFGVGATDLINEFMMGYTSHVGNAPFVKRVRANTESKREYASDKVNEFQPKSFVINPDGKSIKINIFGGIRKSKAQEQREKLQAAKTEAGLFVGQFEDEFGTYFIEEDLPQLSYADELDLIEQSISDAPVTKENRKRKFDSDEKGMFSKNIRDLFARGFTFQDGKLQLPYIINVMGIQEGDDKRNQTYVLKVVGKKGKSKAKKGALISSLVTPEDMKNGIFVAEGIEAVYVPYNFKGSKKTFKGAFVFDEIPDAPKKARVRQTAAPKIQWQSDEELLKQFEMMSRGETDANITYDEENYPAEAPAETQYVKPRNRTTGQKTNKEALKDVYKITMSMTNKTITFSGAAYDAIVEKTGKTFSNPEELLKALGYKISAPAEEAPAAKENPLNDECAGAPANPMDTLADLFGGPVKTKIGK